MEKIKRAGISGKYQQQQVSKSLKLLIIRLYMLYLCTCKYYFKPIHRFHQMGFMFLTYQLKSNCLCFIHLSCFRCFHLLKILFVLPFFYHINMILILLSGRDIMHPAMFLQNLVKVGSTDRSGHKGCV